MKFENKVYSSQFFEYKRRVLFWIRLDPVQEDRVMCNAEIDGAKWDIRINNFPDEILYTLLIDGVEIYDFDDWPTAWVK